MGGGGGPCDFSVSPSPFGLGFGTLDFGTSDLGLTIDVQRSPGKRMDKHKVKKCTENVPFSSASRARAFCAPHLCKTFGIRIKAQIAEIALTFYIHNTYVFRLKTMKNNSLESLEM